MDYKLDQASILDFKQTNESLEIVTIIAGYGIKDVKACFNPIEDTFIITATEDENHELLI